MSNYFKGFPTIQYDINGTEPNQYKTITNIMQRYVLKESVLEDITVYYPYQVLEGERPDIVSYNYYGTTDYAYLILLVNKIKDPLFEWPLSIQQFDSYIVHKYGSVSNAMGITKYYYQIIRAEVPATSYSVRVPELKYVVDETTYNALSSGDKTSISAWTWESDLMDEKRSIKLVNRDFVEDIHDQLIRLQV